MQEIIDNLAGLFKQRLAIDEQIEVALAFIRAVAKEESKHKVKKEKIKQFREEKPKAKRGRKPGKRKVFLPAVEELGKKYRCENCDAIFYSNLDYLDVRCPKCDSKRAINLPL